MKKVCTKIVLRVFTAKPEEWQDPYADSSQFQNIIISNETWIFQYDPMMKQQSMHWKLGNTRHYQEYKKLKSKFKPMLIVFFDDKGLILKEWVPEQ